MILPSKKVLSVFILVAAIVVSTIIVSQRDKSSKVINFTNNLVAGEKISIPENPNWQTELGKVSSNIDVSQTETVKETKETVTDTVSKTLVSNYLTLKQGGALDQTSAQNLIDQTVSLVDRLGSQIVLDTKLNIIKDNGQWSIVDYGENLGTILRNNRPTYKKSEMDIVQEALETNDPKKLGELNIIINTFESFSREMKKMPVPKQFVRSHMDMIIAVDIFIFSLKEMGTVFTDSLRGLQSVQVYGQSVILFAQAYSSTLEFIKSANVDYKQGSGGYYLLHGL